MKRVKGKINKELWANLFNIDIMMLEAPRPILLEAPRPICINYGCGKPATFSRKNEKGYRRWRVHCGHCQGASYGKHEHAPGVTPFKTGKCSNTDEHLGFPCPTNAAIIPEWAKGMTEVDHKDGNPSNNDHSNLDELCPICHKLKGQRSGDFNGRRG